MRVIEVSAQSEGRKERDLGLEGVLNSLDELTYNLLQRTEV